MALKNYNPTTPGQRQLVIIDRSVLYKGKPVKALTEGKSSSGGRNNTGRITVRFRGGGHKQAYRIVDFKRRKFDVPATVERIEYDPNRTAFIALIKYEDGELAYILAPQRLAAGDEVIAGEHVDVKPGNAMPIGNIPVGTIVHNIELKIGKGGQIARSAGSYAQIVGRDHDYVIMRLNSGRAATGAWPLHGERRRGVEPGQHEHVVGKAGRKRWLGRRPHNRGVTMNPVDHPHGGRTTGGGHSVTPWGFPTKGKKTRKNKRPPNSSCSAGTSARRRVRTSIMSRSVWKGPFVDGYLLRKAEASRASGRHEVIKIWSRRSTILPQFVGLTFGVYNGQKHIPVLVTEEMVGHKFGEFSPTRDLPRPYGRSQGESGASGNVVEGLRENVMGKSAHGRTLADNEAKAVSRMLRVSPQKLNLVAQLIRGKKVASALADLEFSRKRIARDVRKCLESAIANAENNHDLDVDDLVVAEAYVGKALVMKRFTPRGRGRVGRILKPFANLTIVVREVEAKAQA